MNIRNPTTSMITTWKGVDIRPGETQNVDVSEAEADWLLRHGCEDADAKPAEKPRATKRRGPRRPEPELD